MLSSLGAGSLLDELRMKMIEPVILLRILNALTLFPKCHEMISSKLNHQLCKTYFLTQIRYN